MLESRETKIIAAYIRSAIADPALGRSQSDKCSEYSIRMFGKEPDVIFCDHGASGMSGPRPQLWHLVKCIKLGQVHALIAADLVRIHRSPSLLLKFFGLMRDYDVALHCVSDGGLIDLTGFSILMPRREPLLDKPTAVS